MTTTEHQNVPRPALARSREDLVYWSATGLFVALFLVSALWELADPAGSKQQMRELGFPDYLLYPLALAKLAGVATILSRRWRTLSTFAFAGFLFDLVLALSAHVHLRQTWGFVAAAGVLIWAGAFAVHLRRFPPTPLT